MRLHSNLPLTTAVLIAAAAVLPIATALPPSPLLATSTTTTTTSSATTPLSSGGSTSVCHLKEVGLGTSFEIHGRSWDEQKLAYAGKGLLEKLASCGFIVDWKFWLTPDDHDFDWISKGYIVNSRTGGCVHHAILNAGGSSIDCDGYV